VPSNLTANHTSLDLFFLSPKQKASEGGSSQAKEVSQNVVLIWTLRPEWFCHFLEKMKKRKSLSLGYITVQFLKQVNWLCKTCPVPFLCDTKIKLEKTKTPKKRNIKYCTKILIIPGTSLLSAQ
jgi:hypothetical protein